MSIRSNNAIVVSESSLTDLFYPLVLSVASIKVLKSFTLIGIYAFFPSVLLVFASYIWSSGKYIYI